MKSSNIVRTLFLIKQNHSLYPPIGGASLRNWQNINVMMKLGPVAVFFLVSETTKNIDIPPGLAMWNVKPVKENKLVGRDKLNQRLQQLKSFITRGHPFTDTSSVCSPELILELKRTLDEFKPDLVVFSQTFLGFYLPVLKSYPCKLILDAHNAETELFRETINLKPVKGLKEKIRTRIEIIKTEVIERELLQDTDQVWTCSKQDIVSLQKLCKKVIKAHVIPNGADSDYYSDVRANQCTLPDGFNPSPYALLFPAIFDYEPNSQAARLLIDDIYPQLKKLYPESQLLLIGAKPTPYMLEAAKKDLSIIVTGRVPDMRPYFMAASIVIVPLLKGSGTRLKILEAFASCRPVVSTPKGAEGINAVNGEHLLIGNTTEELVNNVCKIWSDKDLSQRLAQSAYELFDKGYSWEAVGEKVSQAMEALKF